MTHNDGSGPASMALRLLLRAGYITVVFYLAVLIANLIVFATGPFRTGQLIPWLMIVLIVAGGSVGLRVLSKRPVSAVALAAGAFAGAVIAHFLLLFAGAILGAMGHFNYLIFRYPLGTTGRFGGMHLGDLLVSEAIWSGGIFLGALGGLCVTAGESPRLQRWARRAIRTTAAIVFGSALILYGGLRHSAQSKEKAVNRRWAAAGMPIAGFLEGLPKTRENAAAEKLPALAARLGIPPRSFKGGNAGRADAAARARWEKARISLEGYVDAELHKSGSRCAAPDVATAAYLRAAQPGIKELRDLLSKEKPVWSLKIEAGLVSSIPHLLMQVNLTRILVADALNAHAESRDAVALADVDAAWRLSKPFASRPDGISQLILVTMREMDMGALRKLDGVPPLWQKRLTAWNPRQGLLQGLRAQAAWWETLPKTTAEPGTAGSSSGWMGQLDTRLLSPFTRLYLRLCMADAAGRQLTLIEGEQKIGQCPSQAQVETLGARILASFPWWNVQGKMIW